MLPCAALSFLAMAGAYCETVSLSIDPSSRGSPISKYIYGQFIEHAGRGVYGGLWAEMLEDRKFYFVIRDRYAPWGTATDSNWDSGPYDYLRASPWRIIGPAGTVSMDTEHPFTGIHSPSIGTAATGALLGIAQDGLALQKGRKYVGRVILASDSEAKVRARIVSDEGESIELAAIASSSAYRSFPFGFVSPWDCANARLEIAAAGGGFRVGAASLMPADAIDGWRSDVIALLKELGAPVYRWPGGNFVSGYDWRDGIGERDARPPRQNPAWKGVEPNDVGIDEFMRLMAILGAEPYITVNAGLGSVQDAAAEVEYCVGGENTPMGRLRAANGHSAPYAVAWWGIGNEMYGDWQLGHMSVEDFAKKHAAMAETIRATSRGARLVAVGSTGNWDKAMLSSCPDSIDLLSEHIYRKELKDVPAHSEQLAEDIERIAVAFQGYKASIPSLADKNLGIALDEWNYWYGPYVYGELGVQYHLKDALGVARALHALFRHSDIFRLAAYAQAVNVLGAIKTSATDSCLDATGLALALYRRRFGSIPVAVSASSKGLDLSAALTEKGDALTLAAVNPEQTSRTLSVRIAGGRFRRLVGIWTLSGPGPEASNRPGLAPEVCIREAAADAAPAELAVPACSIVICRYEQ